MRKLFGVISLVLMSAMIVVPAMGKAASAPSSSGHSTGCGSNACAKK